MLVKEVFYDNEKASFLVGVRNNKCEQYLVTIHTYFSPATYIGDLIDSLAEELGNLLLM